MITLNSYITEKLKISKTSNYKLYDLDIIFNDYEEAIKTFENYFGEQSEKADIYSVKVKSHYLTIGESKSIPITNIKGISNGTLYICKFDYGLLFVIMYKENGKWRRTDTQDLNISKHYLFGDNFLDWLEKNKDLEEHLYYIINKKGNA